MNQAWPLTFIKEAFNIYDLFLTIFTHSCSTCILFLRWQTQRCTVHMSLEGRTCCPALGSVATTQLQLSFLVSLCCRVVWPIAMLFRGHPAGLVTEQGQGVSSLWDWLPALQCPILLSPSSFQRCWSLRKILYPRTPSPYMLPENPTRYA